MKTRQVMRRMRAAGCTFTARKGTGHQRVTYRGKSTSFPVHSADMDLRFIKALCRQLGLDWRKVL